MAKIDNLSLESLKWVRGQWQQQSLFESLECAYGYFFLLRKAKQERKENLELGNANHGTQNIFFCKRRRNKKAKSRKTGREGISETRACSSLENTGLKCINERLLVRLKYI